MDTRPKNGEVGFDFDSLWDEPQQVAKVPAEDERSRVLAASVRSYEREVKFYNEIQPTVDSET